MEDVESPHDGLQSFVEFIKEQAEGNEGGRADLVAHNAFLFDGPTLLKNLSDNCRDWVTPIRYEKMSINSQSNISNISSRGWLS